MRYGVDMPITVKRLIEKLEEIVQRHREVEVCLIDKQTLEPGIQEVRVVGKKVLIFLERKK